MHTPHTAGAATGAALWLPAEQLFPAGRPNTTTTTFGVPSVGKVLGVIPDLLQVSRIKKNHTRKEADGMEVDGGGHLSEYQTAVGCPLPSYQLLVNQKVLVIILHRLSWLFSRYNKLPPSVVRGGFRTKYELVGNYISVPGCLNPDLKPKGPAINKA